MGSGKRNKIKLSLLFELSTVTNLLSKQSHKGGGGKGCGHVMRKNFYDQYRTISIRVSGSDKGDRTMTVIKLIKMKLGAEAHS